MKTQLFALSLGFAGLIWATENAGAQPATCGERGVVVAQLQTRYGETRRSLGLGRGNRVIEMFASAETGTWTIVVTLPSGLSCLLAAGESFEAITPDPATLDDPA